MARLSTQSERVKHLVDTQVLPLLLAAGNVAALTKLLNDTLRDSGIEGRLHPNRLHSLLSNDVTRSLNEATVELTEQAACAALEADRTVADRASIALNAFRAEALKLRAFSTDSLEEIAERLSIPMALAARLLDETPGVATGAGASGVLNSKSTIAVRHEPPDWSYQDTAVARCIEAFTRRPAGRVGLVLPTGAGKTRTALRIVLTMLDKCLEPKAPAYWVTHRRNLREQAYRELQKLIAAQTGREDGEKLAELANRIKFIMVGDLTPLLEGAATRPALIIIDEAHHAAAPSYQPVFANPWAAPVLLLTATPNRSDRLPIGIDEIAFTITYRELAERRAVLTPEFLDFPVEDFDWSPEAIDDLADYIVDQTTADFTKVLILAPRIDRVEEFYMALLDRLPDDHPLEAEDIGFVHGAANSLGINNEDFLACFGNKPRAVLISAQLLLEGFDDPSINAVVLTYPSSSVIRLMQAAGRCVRYAPDKRAAYVVQARNDSIAYHFDQRWLYQEIDDFLRPQLIDIEYVSRGDLYEKARLLLEQHRVEEKQAQRSLARIETLIPGETCRLFLYGLPYFGSADQFETESNWGVSLETADTSAMLRGVFNSFCSLGADLSDPSDFLLRDGAAYGLAKDLRVGSRWLELTGLLTASYFAKREVHGPSPIDTMGSRPFKPHGATTWLRYVSFSFRPAVPHALSEFLRDCHNASQIEAAYLETPLQYATAVKVPLPLTGSEAFLLTASATADLTESLNELRQKLAQAAPAEQFGALASHLVSSSSSHLPARLLHRSEFLADPTARAARVLVLTETPSIDTVKEPNNE
ncbi:DEAD/DEAH box helicase [Uliginosibacterium sp. 31-12]|uniref:DEAD/DEAH box helicase n=1 Tax=Uliginosibacterium sp. 31-12 TaxID=3062781 RepID=UPI0026E4027E|nr:DEAD/DEAH box helicase family protein [Uliginosibacterium sp. 31-12]MDO6387905.1 DEAD/DEAH box helicase family protein [Uliginosibacterium sp. 31-12]